MGAFVKYDATVDRYAPNVKAHPPNRRRTTAACLAAASVGLAVAGCRAGRPASEPPAAVDRYVAGYAAAREGDRERAIEELEQAIAQNPNLRMAHGLLADIYREDGLYDEALEHYEAVVMLDPYVAEHFYELGVTYQVLDRLRDAANSYVAGLTIDQDDLNLNIGLGQVYLGLRDSDRALRFLERATRIDPESATAWSSVGVAHDLQGNYAFAEVSYRKALELGPDSPGVKQNLGANLLAQGRAEEAIGFLADAASERPTPLTQKLLGDAYFEAGRRDDALAAYDAALAQDPGFLSALNGKGEALIAAYEDGLRLEESLREQAVQAWRRSLDLRPEQPAIRDLVDRWSDASAVRRG